MVAQYIIIGLYFFILFLIGYWSSGKIKDIADYYVGGKKLGYWVVAFSTRATGESAWLLLGLTGMGAMVGFSAYWVVLGELIGVATAWFLLSKRFKFLTDKYGSITVPDYLVSRFRASSHLIRIIASTALAVFVVIYVSAQIDATGSAFEAFLNWNYYTGALVGFAIVVVYIFLGGFVAVSWSDLFQGSLMFLGLTFLPIVAWFSLNAGGEMFSSLKAIDPSLVNFWGPGGFSWFNLATVLGYLFIGLGFMGSPQLFVRFMSIKDESEIDKGRWVAIAFTLLTDIAAVSIGVIGRYLFTEAGTDVVAVMGNNAQNVLIMMVNNFLPTLLVGLYIAVVLAAIMSTIDSLLIVASSAIVRDFYQQIYHPELKVEQLTRMSRVVTVALAVFALGIALTVAITTPSRTIFWFVIFGWSGIAATFCPVIILSLFWKGYTEKGAIASMVTGFLCVPIFKFVVPAIPGVGAYFGQIAELGPSFALAMIFGFTVSKIWPNKALEQAVAEELISPTFEHND
ncbi:MAG: sodium/proline symporter [Bacteroidota bacterium]